MDPITTWDVLLVEDQEIFRQLLGYYLHRDPRFRLVGEADSGAKALTAWRQLRPQLIVIDLNLPDISGVDLAEQLLAHGCVARLLAVTAREDGRIVVQSHTAGFHGYVLKSDPFPELLAAMSLVAQGGLYLSEKAQRLRAGYLREKKMHGQVLSEREDQVLRLAATGMTNQAIAIELNLSVRTVESHRYRLMHKLDLRDTAGMVNYAWRQGLIAQNKFSAAQDLAPWPKQARAPSKANPVFFGGLPKPST